MTLGGLVWWSSDWASDTRLALDLVVNSSGLGSAESTDLVIGQADVLEPTGAVAAAVAGCGCERLMPAMRFSQSADFFVLVQRIGWERRCCRRCCRHCCRLWLRAQHACYALQLNFLFFSSV